MSERPFNPSEQVERIREILVGRQMGRFERRLGEVETSAETALDQAQENTQATENRLASETQRLRQEIQAEVKRREADVARLDELISHQKQSAAAVVPNLDWERRLSERVEMLSTEMTARIDARTREILQHLQQEIFQWKAQTDRELQSIREVKIDRKEFKARLTRLVAAAMDDETDDNAPDGFLI